MAVRKNAMLQMRESEYRRELANAVTTAYNIALAVMLASAHDVFGFGEKRLYRLLDHANKLSNELNDGDISMEDLVEAFADDKILLGFDKLTAKGFRSPGKKR